MKHIKISSEKLAYWYFRLNGCLTIENFVVHTDEGLVQGTDVDVLAVRFPFRKELIKNSMVDDQVFYKTVNKPYIILAEVKRGQCGINRSWKDRKSENIFRILSAIGAFPEESLTEAVNSVYDTGIYVNDSYLLSLYCLGDKYNRGIGNRYKDVPQKTWDDVLTFIYNRFSKYKKQKKLHDQWEDTGQQLWDCFLISTNCESFKSFVEIE